MNFLKGKKTYIIAGLMVLSSIVRLIVGDITIIDFIMSQDVLFLLNGLGLGTLRAGISNK